mmetsp:Transcript_19828/g.50660  ORF Transcript_19828/g.50660 Transcript_19828/m.50660 type:complete len:268 (-) Transcript_19828:132-935(-)
MACCCCCIPHYTNVSGPEIGRDIIESHQMGSHTTTGDSMPLIEIALPPQQCMISEPGAMSFLQKGIGMETIFDDGSSVNEPGCCTKCKTCCLRTCSGEGASVAHWTNNSDSVRQMGFASALPGHIVAIDLKTMPENMLFTMNGSFLFGTKGTRIDVARTDCKQCCCGAGLFFQKLDGDGKVFLNAGGTIIKQNLNDETHRIDPASLVAFTKGLTVDVQKAGTCMTMCCGGEGMALTTISGQGDYWIASSPWTSQLAYALGFLPPKKS